MNTRISAAWPYLLHLEQCEHSVELAGGPDFRGTARLLLQVGMNLIPVLDSRTSDGRHFQRMTAELRNSLWRELGVIYPPVQVSGSSLLPRADYVIHVNEAPVMSGHVQSDAQRALAAALARAMRKQVRDFIGTAEVVSMVDRLRQTECSLVDAVVPTRLSIRQFTELLQRLLDEGVSIRDLRSILRVVGRQVTGGQDIPALVEHVRTALKDDICRSIADRRPFLFVHNLAADIETSIRDSVREDASGSYIAMDNATVKQIVNAVERALDGAGPSAQRPVILAEGDIRRFVKRLLDCRFPEAVVMSREQVSSGLRVRSLGTITLRRRTRV